MSQTFAAPVPTVFPGIVYGPGGKALDRDRPNLSQVLIDAAPARGLVVPDEPADFGEPNEPSRFWLLNLGARWEDIPGNERYAALSLLRCGHSVLLLAAEAEAEASIRAGLVYLLGVDQTPTGRFGHA
jgi:hypothetical protein